MAKSPKVFDRLYVNMIKAGEAGGALEVILQRLADFMETCRSAEAESQGRDDLSGRRRLVAVGILTFIMIKIVPTFQTDVRRLRHGVAAAHADADCDLREHGQATGT